MAPKTARTGQRALQGFLERLRFTFVALLVSAFPESVKRGGWPSAYASAGAHVFGGWVEALVSASLFGLGFLNYVAGFIKGPGETYLMRKPGALTHADFFGTGALGYVSFLFTPVAWVTLFCFVEGILRALDAVFSERMLGMAFVALPWRGVRALKTAARRRRHEATLGPDRPDEVVTGKAGEAVALTIFTARERPWADHQVIEVEGDFYEAVGKRLVERGGHYAYRYDFRRLDHGEVIRGMLLRYPSAAGAPSGTNPADPVGPAG